MTDSGRLIELERPPVIETAVLVRLILPNDADGEVAESLAEMRQLAWTAGADVACTFVQHRPKPSPGTLIGEGKIDEIKGACDELDANLAIFDSDLTPAQGAKLESLLGVKIVDRTQLILDIFAQRARTNEGKRQVELAQLHYTLPRLTGRGSVMRQQGGIGTRGPGEQKLEVDRRVIRRRINRLTKELDGVRKHRRIQRKRRVENRVPSVALVGYTNAGKSSLLNALSGAEAFVENKLFATLDPCSRACVLPSGREAVFTDTVGFIRKLPHTLVAAFRATLEEVNEADLLVLVADAAHPAVEEHIRAVHNVLEEIQADELPVLTVFNKLDIANPDDARVLMCDNRPNVGVSARTGEGIDSLLRAVDSHVAPALRLVTLRIPQRDARIVGMVYESGRVLNERYENNTIVLDAEINRATEGKVEQYIQDGSGAPLPRSRDAGDEQNG